MASTQEIKDRVFAEIDARADEIVGVAREILAHPEAGYREVRTSQLVAERLRGLDISCREGLALTGVKGSLSGGSDGPAIAVLGELDSLLVNDHPHADPGTGAAHACGHHAQIGMMLGVATALKHSGVMPDLGGRVTFMAVPAEEFIEIEWRDEMRQQGKIEFLGGKPELVRLGEFDDVDVTLLVHSSANAPDKMIGMGGTNNGLVAKRIQFLGRGAHAGGAPHLGINALNAASLAMAAINANRETFRDDDTVRVHPIITKGGEAVSAVPADVRMETFVRGKTLEAITDANVKVDRALKAGAMAVGGRVKIQTIPGYLPLRQDDNLSKVFEENANGLVGADNVGHVPHRGTSTDMGDISHLMPLIQPYAGGCSGIAHGSDFLVEDYQLGVLTAAKALAGTVVDLLSNGAAEAGRIMSNHKPAMNKDEYLRFLRGLAKDETFDGAR